MAGENNEFEITRDGVQDGAESIFGETAGDPQKDAMYARFQERFGTQKETGRAALRLMTSAEMEKLRKDVAEGREQEAVQAVAEKFLQYYVGDFAQLERNLTPAGLEANLDKIEKSGEFAPSLCSSLLGVLSRQGYAVSLDAGRPVVEAKPDAKPSAAEIQSVLVRRAAAPAFSDALRRGLVFRTTAAAEPSDKPAKTSDLAVSLRKKYGMENDADFTPDNVRAKVADAGDRAFLLSFRSTPEYGAQDAMSKSADRTRQALALIGRSVPASQLPDGPKAEGMVAAISRDPFQAVAEFANKGKFCALAVAALFVLALIKNWKATLLTVLGLGALKEMGGLDKFSDWLGGDKAKDLSKQVGERLKQLPDQARALYGNISERLDGKLAPEESGKFHLDLNASDGFRLKTAGQLHAALAKGGDLAGFFGDVADVGGVTGAAYWEKNQGKLRTYLEAFDRQGYSAARKDALLGEILGGSLVAAAPQAPSQAPVDANPEGAAPATANDRPSAAGESALFAPGSYLAFDEGRPALFTRDGKRARLDTHLLNPESREAVRSQSDLSLFLETYEVWRSAAHKVIAAMWLKPLRHGDVALEERLKGVDASVGELYQAASSGKLDRAAVQAKIHGTLSMMKGSEGAVWFNDIFDAGKYAQIEKILKSDEPSYEKRLRDLLDAMRSGITADGDSAAVRERVVDYLVHSNRPQFEKARKTLANPGIYAVIKDIRAQQWEQAGIPAAIGRDVHEFQLNLQAESGTRRSLDLTRQKIEAAHPELDPQQQDEAVTAALDAGVRAATLKYLEGALADEVISNDPSVSSDPLVKLAGSARWDVRREQALDFGVDLVMTAATFVPAAGAVKLVGMGANTVSKFAWAERIALAADAASEGSVLAKWGARAAMGAGTAGRIGLEGAAFYEAQAAVSGILFRENFSEIGADMADGVGIAKSVAFMGVMHGVTKVMSKYMGEVGYVSKTWSSAESKDFVTTWLIPRAGLVAAEGSAITVSSHVIDVVFDQPRDWTLSEFVQGMALVGIMRGMAPAKSGAARVAKYELYKAKDGKPAVKEVPPEAAKAEPAKTPDARKATDEARRKEIEDLKASIDETLSPEEIAARLEKIAKLEAEIAAPEAVPAASAAPAAKPAYGLDVVQREGVIVRTLKDFSKNKDAKELDLGDGLKATKDAAGRVVIDGKTYDKKLDDRFAELAREKFGSDKEAAFGAFARARMEATIKEAPANLYHLSQNWLRGVRFTSEGKQFVIELERTKANPAGVLKAREVSADGKANGALRDLTEADRAAMMDRFADKLDAQLNGPWWSKTLKWFYETGFLNPKNRDAIAEAKAKDGTKAALKKFGAMMLTGKVDPSLARQWTMGVLTAGGMGYSVYRGAKRDDASVLGETAQGTLDIAALNLLGTVGVLGGLAVDAAL